MKLAALALFAGCTTSRPMPEDFYHCVTEPVAIVQLEMTPQSSHVLEVNEYSNLFPGAIFGNGSCLDNGVGFDCTIISWQQVYESWTFVPDDTFEFMTFSFEGQPRTFQCTTSTMSDPAVSK